MTGAEPEPGRQGHPDEAGEPLWMLRLNPLRRTRLADPELLRAVRALHDAEGGVREAAERCSDELHAEIGGTTDPDLRGRLIALRRAVHNDRTPRAELIVERPCVEHWRQVRARRDTARRQVAECHEEAIGRERTRLAELLADDDLRRSLALVAREAGEGAERYRAAVARPGGPSARLRKTERGLLQYVTRAMVRTSPLTRFTAVGLAVPETDGPGPDTPVFEGMTSFPGLDRAMLDYVMGGLQVPPRTLDPATLVQLPPTADIAPDAGRLYFLRPDGDGMRRLSAPLSPTVLALLEVTAMGPRRFDAVVADFAARAGCAPEQAMGAVRKAVDAGILCTRARPEDGGAEWTDLLRAPESPAAPLLHRIAEALPRVADASPGEQTVELGSLRASLMELSRVARRPAQIPVEEDTLLSGLRVSTARWRSQLEDLAAGVRLLSAFDMLHDVRALLSAAFVERFGAGADIPLVPNADHLVREVYRRGMALETESPADLGPADGSLERLYTLRERVTERLRADLTAAGAEGRDLTWTAAGVDDLVAGIPDRFRREPLAYGVLVQTWRQQLVFNDAYAGHGMLHGRFLGADRALGGRALDHLADRLPRYYGATGNRVVEDAGLHRLNVNAHPRVLDDALEPDDWYALRLVHDPDTDELAVRDTDGRRVIVLTLGTGHPEMYPPPLRLANWLYAGGQLREDLVHDWHTTVGGDTRDTRRCPRFSVGSAILARRRWYGGEELEAVMATGPEDRDRLLALQRWRARHGVPEEVVLKTVLDVTDRAPGGDGDDRRGRDKPQYVDLACALGVRVLPRMRERRGAGYVEEALPGVCDAPRAAEWVVEIGRTANGSFQYGGKPI
ncbi:lantibiotic dehydratase family protein [Streptomyces sp. ST2-7A]|uniref:lantibiotic dehydratase family protein n=1 Tax=Streptomyces sp. ST2-7A TaxID=2907214 RepID=UPI001F1D5A56|nr:lantibiotic dehydratase family protein [Streptomyces sp. ST2-7A]MCE7080561.1 lantibiotic dehydratase family protein [Streptomyces sp. ST2-7A]